MAAYFKQDGKWDVKSCHGFRLDVMGDAGVKSVKIEHRTGGKWVGITGDGVAVPALAEVDFNTQVRITAKAKKGYAIAKPVVTKTLKKAAVVSFVSEVCESC